MQKHVLPLCLETHKVAHTWAGVSYFEFCLSSILKVVQVNNCLSRAKNIELFAFESTSDWNSTMDALIGSLQAQCLSLRPPKKDPEWKPSALVLVRVSTSGAMLDAQLIDPRRNAKKI
eukprot:1754102-Amphidinium_carterae.1